MRTYVCGERCQLGNDVLVDEISLLHSLTPIGQSFNECKRLIATVENFIIGGSSVGRLRVRITAASNTPLGMSGSASFQSAKKSW